MLGNLGYCRMKNIIDDLGHRTMNILENLGHHITKNMLGNLGFCKMKNVFGFKKDGMCD
jgi:hypothetical protein